MRPMGKVQTRGRHYGWIPWCRLDECLMDGMLTAPGQHYRVQYRFHGKVS